MAGAASDPPARTAGQPRVLQVKRQGFIAATSLPAPQSVQKQRTGAFKGPVEMPRGESATVVPLDT